MSRRLGLVVVAAAAACANAPEPRGDWCGTDRARLHETGELAQACGAGDLYACAAGRVECRRDRWACVEPPVLGTDEALDRCLARERDEGVRCDAAAADGLATGAAPAIAKLCAAGDWRACHESALVAEHARETTDVDARYRAACDRGVGAACARAGQRAWDRGDARTAIELVVRACGDSESRACAVRDSIVGRASELEDAGRYDDLVAVLRIGCFRGNDTEACGALDAFRERARAAADSCAGSVSRCRAPAAMIRAASQGPADLERARRLEEAPLAAVASPPSSAREPDELDGARKCIDARTEQRGCVTLRWTIAADGSVRSASVDGVGDERSRACLLRAMRGSRFGPGAQRTVERPLNCAGSIPK